MNRFSLIVAGMAVGSMVIAGCERQERRAEPSGSIDRGRELFSRHCAGCHPDGGNALYPQKTLHRFDLSANGIVSPPDIVAKMRNPGEGMKKFDRNMLPDSDADAIARYILATFN